MTKGEVTISIAELDELRTNVHERDRQIAELLEQIRTIEADDPTGRVKRLLDTVRSVLPVVQFATGNLDPATIRGWPYQSLDIFAKRLRVMPAANETEKALALELSAFAREAKNREAERAGRKPAPPPGPVNTPTALEARKLADATRGSPALPPEAADAVAGKLHDASGCGFEGNRWRCTCGCQSRGALCCRLRAQIGTPGAAPEPPAEGEGAKGPIDT